MEAFDRDDLLTRLATEPTSADTWARWSWLVDQARDDLARIKLLESHVDALNILRDLDPALDVPDGLLAVWAAEPPGVPLDVTGPDDAAVLRGSKAFCSGAALVDGALVTATRDGESVLVLVDVAGARADGAITIGPDAWVTAGMHRAGTRTLDLVDVPCRPVGRPGDYVGRAGFWHGAVGVAACWHGGTLAVADLLHARARRRPGDPLARRRLAVLDVDLAATDAMLRRCAGQVDAGGLEDQDTARRAAELVRAQAAGAARRVLDVVRTALGPGPLAHDEHAATTCEDLSVFVLQHHGDRDLEALGELVESEKRPW